MIGSNESDDTKWLSVIGRSLAYLCYKSANLEDKSLNDKAQFLSGLGLSRAECASILGTTEASLSVLQNYHKKKKARKKANATEKKSVKKKGRKF